MVHCSLSWVRSTSLDSRCVNLLVCGKTRNPSISQPWHSHLRVRSQQHGVRITTVTGINYKSTLDYLFLDLD